MRLMPLIPAAAALVAGLATFTPAPATACSCARLDRAAAENAAAVVFEGIPEVSAPLEARPSQGRWWVTVFRITQPVKGLDSADREAGGRIAVQHRVEGNLCGLRFTPGQVIRLYAHPRAPARPLAAGAPLTNAPSPAGRGAPPAGAAQQGMPLATGLCAFPPEDLPQQP